MCNYGFRYLYAASVVPAYLVLLVTIVLAVREAGASISSFKKAFVGKHSLSNLKLGLLYPFDLFRHCL